MSNLTLQMHRSVAPKIIALVLTPPAPGWPYLDLFNGLSGTLLPAHRSDSNHRYTTDYGNFILDGAGVLRLSTNAYDNGLLQLQPEKLGSGIGFALRMISDGWSTYSNSSGALSRRYDNGVDVIQFQLAIFPPNPLYWSPTNYSYYLAKFVDPVGGGGGGSASTLASGTLVETLAEGDELEIVMEVREGQLDITIGSVGAPTPEAFTIMDADITGDLLDMAIQLSAGDAGGEGHIGFTRGSADDLAP